MTSQKWQNLHMPIYAVTYLYTKKIKFMTFKFETADISLSLELKKRTWKQTRILKTSLVSCSPQPSPSHDREKSLLPGWGVLMSSLQMCRRIIIQEKDLGYISAIGHSACDTRYRNYWAHFE